MKIRLSRRIIALAVAFVMVMGMLPTVAFARTAGKDGSAEMNEAYAAKETLMPIGPSFSTYTLLEWTPESDPDAVYSRASIPLKERVGGFVVNPLANPEAKLMLCSLANSDHDHTSAQGTESFLSYSFNYWQYVDSFVYWSGSQEGLVVVPTGEFTDAAHTNGVPVVATLGFPWGWGAGYAEEVDAFCQKAADGTFPVADKMIEVMDYYGFDGYFFNQESSGCSGAVALRLKEMIHYMHAKRPDMLISWYDSMTEGGSVSYGDGVNSYNKLWMEDDANGVRGVDEFFMNYNWTASKISTTISTMKSIGRSQFDAFAGIDVQQNCMDTWFNDHLLVDADGLAKLSLALYCPNSTLGLSADGAQFHEVERTFYTNAVEDPRDTSIDITSSSEYDWAGMSRLFADKTPITSAPFVSDFNSGHGTGYYVDGVLSRDAEWSYQSNQDVMPTWTWIIDSNGSKLSGDYDFTDAYNGGTSIKFYGNLDAANDILIYSTDIAVENKMTLALTAKGGLENASLVAYLDDGSAAAYADCEQVITALATGEGWVETVVDLSAYAGKTLKAIGLKVEGSDPNYQINLGRITVLDKTRAALKGPASVTLDEIMYTDAYTAEARIYWDKVTGADVYEIYKVNADGSKSLIMATPSTAFYLPTLKRAAEEEDVTLEIVPINRNGVRGTGKEFTIDWAYANGDTEEVLDLVFENVCLNAPVTGVSFENSGEPASKALDGTAANNSKWCATNMSSGWMSIDIGREVTVRRWRVEHAEYGGESNDMNTIDFALEYKDKNSNTWVQVKRIQNNHDAVTDVLLDTPVTAQEWRLYVYNDGSSPWGGIRIYEWQMFETAQFPQTAVVPMHFAAAVNGVGAADTFTLDKVPTGQTVKVYDAEGNQLGEAVSAGETVTLTGLDFGTAEAGRVYYTTTSNSAAESAKLSAPFEAESAEKSAPATDVEFVKYSHPGSVSSSNGADIYTTLTVKGLSEGDVVYVLGDESKTSLPATGDSVSIDGVRVVRAGGQLQLQVKRVGQIISDPYTVTTPVFPEPTATIQVFAENARGETLTGVRFDVVNAAGETVSQMSTTSDSGAKSTVALGTYTIRNTESPEGYGLAGAITAIARIEGWQTTYTVTIPEGSVEPTDPTDPEPTDPEPTDPVLDPSDDSRDIPLSVLKVSAGDWQTGYEDSEGPAELAVDNNPNTIWHTDWYGTSNENHWFQFELTEEYDVDGLRYWPRQSGNENGTITKYEIQVSDDGVEFETILTGDWENSRQWKIASFEGRNVKYVRLVSKEAVSDVSYVVASAAEIRLTGDVHVPDHIVPPEMEANDDSRDIPVSILTATAGDWQTGYETTEGPAYLVLDNDYNTLWHTDWYGTSRANHWIQFELSEDYAVDGLRYKPRGGNSTNGNITEYDIQVSNDGETFTSVVTGNWAGDSSWKIAQFPSENVKFVRLVAIDAETDNSYVFASAAEIRLTGWARDVSSVDKTELNELIAQCEQIEQGNYTNKSWQKFQSALETARAVAANPNASQTKVNEALENLRNALAGLEENTGEGVQKILHLDSGRTYYSKDWTIALLNEMAAAGYTHLQLAFGNDGMRFVLDDMTIEANGKTYASSDVKAAIELGNEEYNKTHTDNSGDSFCAGQAFEKNALTEEEMDEIIAHAESVGIEIIPHLNMPGHMDALLDAMVELGISGAHFTGYTTSDRSLDLNNAEAVAFLQALIAKYAEYFSAKGSKYFHIGADEYGNDAYSGNMGFPSMGSALYAKFAEFVNGNAAIVESCGMTARAWNDGIYYGSYTAEFDPDIEITYWSSGWWGYNLAKTSKFIEKGNGLINTHGDYYFILGANDAFTEGNSTSHTPGVYLPAESYDITRFMDGSTVEDPVGGMFCIWGDHPFAETETEVAANIRLALRAMALRMDDLPLDGMNTGVVEGGFNEDGTINGGGEVIEPIEPADKSQLETYIDYAEEMNPDNYTDESWAAVEEALENARAVYADPDATQEEVDEVTELLVSAILMLENAPSYFIFVSDMENGTVIADKETAREGELVTLTVTPDEGYSLKALYVNDIAIEGNTFTMPGRDVTITAEFAADFVDNDAIEAAREAAAAAEAAQAAAEEAQRKAEEALAAAEEAAASAAEDREAAEKAQQEAAEAQAAAEAAQKAAEDAQAAAEAAAAAAEANDAAAAAAAAEAAKHAQEVAELYQEIAAMKAQMAEYLKDAQKSAEEAEEHRKAAEAAELACAKYYALIRLSKYADADDYNAAGQAELEAIVAEAIEAINAAETVEAVQEALAAALAAIDMIGYELPFVDVPADSFYYNAVKWALLEGITTGTSETTFSPDKTITRAEAVTFLWRAKGCPEPTTTENPFKDVAETDFFYKAVLWALENEITTGLTTTTFAPYATASRSQIVTFLWRAEGKPEANAENPFTDVADNAWYHDAVIWAVENGITTGMTNTFFDANGTCNRAQVVTFLYRTYK